MLEPAPNRNSCRQLFRRARVPCSGRHSPETHGTFRRHRNWKEYLADEHCRIGSQRRVRNHRRRSPWRAHLPANHVPRHRKNDVTFFDPKNHAHALVLNVLDSEQRGLVVSHVVSIFHKLWADSWGPRLEDILRNSLWALIEQPAPTSLLALPKLLTDDGYRADLLRHVENPLVLDFFCNTFARWTSSFREEAISPVLNKARAFLTDPLMRAVIGQTRSSFNFRWMMDHRKILLCDLAKGSIGDDNSKLLGSLIVLKEKLAALSRQDIAEPERVPHVLYVE